MERKKYHVSGMFCAACVGRVDKAAKAVKGVKAAEVSLLTNSMIVSIDEDFDENNLIKAIEGAGYGCALDMGENVREMRNRRKKELGLQLARVIAAFVIAALTMYFGMAHMSNWPSLGFAVDQSIALALSILVMGLYYDYFYHGLKALFRLHPDMLSLVSLGSLISFIYSLYVYIRFFVTGVGGHTYFDTASMILFFISLGKFLEAVAKAQSTSSLEALLALMPEKAFKVVGEETVEVDASALRPGDIVLVKPGSKVPSDGKVVDGYGNLEEAALTGESAPVYKAKGDKVMSGSMNLTGSFKMEVEAVGENTTLRKIARMVEEASGSKGKLSAIADTLSLYFVPVIIGLSLITFIVWISITGNLEDSLLHAVSTLVVACPCALGLATPVAVMVGAGRGSKLGILFKDARSFESLAKAKALIVDKTGTLTTGHLAIVGEMGFDEKTLVDVYSLESLSEHPLAWSIALYLEKKGLQKKKATDFKNIPGQGIVGKVDGKDYAIGNAALMKEVGVTVLPEEAKANAEKGLLVTYVASGKKVIGYFMAEDSLKPLTKETIESLQKEGVEVVLASGDSKKRTASLAAETGITRYYGEVKPEDKERIVEEIKGEGKLVAMCGDGINDAPALKRSDVGISIGTGTELAVDSSDIVLREGSMKSLEEAFILAKKVRTNIVMNLFWALIYNLCLVPLAAGVLAPIGFQLDPMWASLAMALSSLFVILNALRLKVVSLNGK